MKENLGVPSQHRSKPTNNEVFYLSKNDYENRVYEINIASPKEKNLY